MSTKRHTLGRAGATDPEDAIVARSLGLGLPSDHTIESHSHPWAQVVLATEGVLRIGTSAGTWVVPPQRAAWLPAGQTHEVRATGRVRMKTVYLRPDLVHELPGSCCVLSVTPLLRELVVETVRRGMLRADVEEEWHLARVLVDQVRATPDAPLELVWPADARARRVASLVQSDLASSAPLAELARGSGASVRTLERLFLKETALTFQQWRSQARLLHALQRLAAGESVTATALDVGFSSTSAFIAMFRRALGKTPGNYFRATPRS